MQPGPDPDARLLIVDDEPANVRLLEHTLELAGYDHLHATTDSRQALGLYREVDPDLVLLDLAMPHLDGYEVMRRLREAVPDHAYLPILVLTADLAQFARATSHELAEPLRMVASHVQLLARRHADRLGDDADHIRFAVEGTTRMHSLLGDLLAYTQAATADPARAPVALDAVVAEVLRRLDGAVTRAGATVTVGPLPTVSADPAQLTQVLLHLVDNAVKFHAPGRRPTVRVSADRGVQGSRVSVADDGIGIAPHHAERLFTLFQRLHHRDQYPGNGIGLVLCKRLVEHHGGRVWVDPGPGGGTVVTFTIPDPG